MLFTNGASAALLALIPAFTRAATVGQRQTTSSCSGSNAPGSRNTWCTGYDINTDFDLAFPDSGRTVTYNLEITNTTCNPDGFQSKQCFLINNQYPGPTISAKWGDTIKINVKNSMQDNGTSIHWHGIRQFNSGLMDGVNGVTECPIAPGKTRTYQFKATQYGTSWYHSHHSSQYGEGIVGPIVIDGPATSDYDVDLGPLTLTDWFYTPVWTLNYRATHFAGAPPSSQNVLVNGTMVNRNGGGSYKKITVEKGKKYRLRLINTSVDQFFHVSMDGHPFTIIAADFVPVNPKTGITDLKLHIGQRYDIIFTASQAVGNYWLRVQPGCTAGPEIYTTGKTVGAIISYSGAPAGNPTSTSYSIATTCEDEVVTTFWGTRIPDNAISSNLKNINITFGSVQSPTEGNLVTWFLDGKNFIADWQNPVLQHLFNGDKSLGTNTNIVEMTGDASTWYFWIILNTTPTNPPLAHPIHLHGHDFWLLATGTGPVSGNINGNAPLRRDVATLPANGWMIMAMPANNPGSWIMHCHIAWHAAQGLSYQFLERKSEIKAAQPAGAVDAFTQGCKDWNSWYSSSSRHFTAQYDSGI